MPPVERAREALGGDVEVGAELLHRARRRGELPAAPLARSGPEEDRVPVEQQPEPLVEMIDLEEQLAKGGNVPALINATSDDTKTLAKELVTAWNLKGSQAWWRMQCLIEMEKRASLMAPLQMDTIVYMGQVVARCAAPMPPHCASVDILWQNGVGTCDISSTFEVPMGAKKVFRYFSAMAVRWKVDQDMADFREAFAGAATEDLVHMKAGHLVKISFGNDRVRTEPWLIRFLRHANVHEVAE